MSSILRAIIFAVSATEVAASCAYGTHLMPRAEEGTVPVHSFGYSGSIGPASWHSLNATANGACASGSNQSPIDMVPSSFKEVAGSQLSLVLPDFDEGAEFENLGTTVEVVGDGGTLTLTSSNKTFDFKQFHFHLPSEHLDNGTSMAMEMHMVFSNADSEISVIGVYLDVNAAPAASSATKKVHMHRGKNDKNVHLKGETGTRRGCANTLAIGADAACEASTGSAAAASKMLETVFASVDQISNPGTRTKTAAFAMADLVKTLSATTFQSYSGSLTTPPCSEGVNWFVATDKLSVTLDTYKSAREVIGFNARFPQNAPGEPNILGKL